MTNKNSVLFVCLGNICRSPIAEAVFYNMLKERKLEGKWEVDSAALGPWHVGNEADERALEIMHKYNILKLHKARQITKQDFENFQFILGMDDDNIFELEGMAPPDHSAKIELLGSYDPQKERIIRDPYFDKSNKGFQDCYNQCVRCCKAFLDQHT